MISKAERTHILQLKQWSRDSRKAIQDVRETPLGKALIKFSDGAQSPEMIFDNIDWLIALIERESHTAGVKALLKAVEQHEASSR